MSTNNHHHNNHSIHKVTISGPTLTSLLSLSTTTTTTGLLYGSFSQLPSSPLSDDPPPSSASPPPPSLLASISSFSFSSPSSSPHRFSVIGSFSSRPSSPLLPSLLDHSSATSLPSSPSIFLLLTTTPPSPIHTHSYRAYQFHPTTLTFHPVSLEIINIGPSFRPHYSQFTPTSSLPWTACVSRVGSPMREDGSSRSLSELKRVGVDQKELDVYVAGGYDVGSLCRLVGGDAVGYMSAVEELYDKMLAKLNALSSVVDTSSARVLELELHNTKLRRKVAGIE